MTHNKHHKTMKQAINQIISYTNQRNSNGFSMMPVNEFQQKVMSGNVEVTQKDFNTSIAGGFLYYNTEKGNVIFHYSKTANRFFPVAKFK